VLILLQIKLKIISAVYAPLVTATLLQRINQNEHSFWLILKESQNIYVEWLFSVYSWDKIKNKNYVESKAPSISI